jgi:hypothetical protein
MAWTRFSLPVKSDTHDLSGTIRLDGSDFEYRLLWNDRTNQWTFSLSRNGTTFVEGRTLCLGIDVLRRCTVVGRPVGQLFIWRDDASFAQVDHDDLGGSVQLYYLVGTLRNWNPLTQTLENT